MNAQETLLEILKELQIGEDSFMQSFVNAQMVSSISKLVFSIIFLVALIGFFKFFNNQFNIITNTKELLLLLKGEKLPIKEEEYKEKEHIENSSEELTFSECMGYINRFINKYSITRYFLTIIIVWTEISWFMQLVTTIICNITLLINCFIAPYKILMDYLNGLF